jgi:hypothetical protein
MTMKPEDQLRAAIRVFGHYDVGDSGLAENAEASAQDSTASGCPQRDTRGFAE